MHINFPKVDQNLVVRNTFYDIPEAKPSLRRSASDGEISGSGASSSGRSDTRSTEDFGHFVWSSESSNVGREDRSQCSFSSDDEGSDTGNLGTGQFRPSNAGYMQQSSPNAASHGYSTRARESSSMRGSHGSSDENISAHELAATLEHVNQLVSELRTHPNVFNRLNAAKALGKTTTTDKIPRQALELSTHELVNALKDQHFKVRAAAVCALGTLGPDAAMHSSAIADMLQDEYYEVRAASCIALGKLGREDSPGLQRISALVGALKDTQRLVRAAAASAIGVLSVPHPLPSNALAALLSDPDAGVRASAAYSLGKLGSSAIPHAAVLATTLEDENAKVRESGAHAIGKLGDAAIPYMKVLTHGLNDNHPSVRGASANALGNLGYRAKPHVGELSRMLNDGNLDVCASAAFAIGKFGEAATPYVGKLQDMLENPHAKIRKAAGCALSKLGYEVVAAHADKAYENSSPKGPAKSSYGEGQIISL